MSVIASLRKKSGAALSLQILLVLLTFGLLTFLSYHFVGNVERERMADNVIGALNLAQVRIESDLEQSAAMVAGLALTVQRMIQEGDSLPAIKKQFQEISNYARKVGIPGFLQFFGYFDAFNGVMFDGDGIQIDNIKAEERPWYAAAVNAKGKSAFTGLYPNLITQENIVSCVRRIYDDNGNPLGIIGMDMGVDELVNIVTELNPFEGSYGILSDDNAVIIAHPDKALIGKRVSDIASNADQLENELREDGLLFQRYAQNVTGASFIVHYKTLEKYQWGIGAITPENAYITHTRAIAWFFIALNALVLLAFSYLLMHLSKMKRRNSEFVHVMFNAMPLACLMWNNERKIIMCNSEALRIYGAPNKEHLFGNIFSEYSQKQQPCGGNSEELSAQHIEKTFSDGYDRFEWIHRRFDGETLPAEITLIRALHDGKPIVLSYVRDLREEKAASEKIREADERAQTMLDAVPMCANFWDSDFRNIDCNLEAVRLFGLSSKQEYLDKFHELSPDIQPDGRHSETATFEYIKQAMEKGSVRFDWMHKKINGEPIPVEVTLVRVKHRGKDIVAGYTRDLREVNAAMAKLREADERAMMMLDTAPLGVTMWDRNYNLIDFNYEAARVVGIYSKPEYRERFSETTPEFQEDGTKSAEKFVHLLSTTFKEGHCRTNWTHNTIEGEAIPFDAMAFRVKYKDDDVALVYCRDLREMNIAIAKMREADERAQLLLDSTPISCTLFDENLNPIDCNQEAFKLVGAIDKQDYLRNFLKYSPEFQPDGMPTTRKSPYIALKALENGFHRLEWMHRHANGEIIPCELTLVRVKYRSSDIVAGYAKDLREVKEMVKNMHRAEIAEKSNRAKSKFLAAMSHEIRTPMNVILGVAEMQLQDETLAPHQKEALMQIYNSSDLLLGIINDILDLSKIEADKMEFNPSKYELASLISDTASLNIMRSSRPTEFELIVSENAPASLYGDELRIKQILNNILSNAFKFTDEGTVKFIVDVIEEENKGNDVTLCVTVADTGRGMSPEQVSRLFTEYTRFNLEANRTVEGTGLGMNITQRLVNLMGGKISVESELDKGTTVSIRLPQKRAGDELVGKELAENLRKFRVDSTSSYKRSQFKREYMPYGKVLIVDDVESNLYVAKGLMAPYGLSIEVANCGRAAIERVEAGEVYDVIFMDHMMPKMDGVETVKRIRELGYNHPIVALTANAVVGQADQFLKNGFDDFISKPIDVRQLNSILNRMVRDKQPPEVLEKAHKDRENAQKQIFAPSGTASPDLLAVFARDANKTLPILEYTADNIKNLSDDDMRLFTTSVHGMKTALANIGEARLSQMALVLEKAGKSNNKETVAGQLQNFIKALRGVTAKAEVESRTKDAASEDEDPEYLREQLTAIAAACRELDERTVAESLEKLKTMAWTAATEETLDKIAEMLLHSNFDEAAEIAEGYAKA